MHLFSIFWLIFDFLGVNLGFLLLHVVGRLAHLFGLLGSDDVEAFLDGLDGLDRGGLLGKGFLWKCRTVGQELTDLFLSR